MKLKRKKLVYHTASPVWILLCLYIAMLMFLSDTIEAKSQKKSLTVAVKDLPPFVMETENRYAGLDVERWEEIAKALKLKLNYRSAGQWRIFSDLVEGKADIAFSCIPITREFEENPTNLLGGKTLIG